MKLPLSAGVKKVGGGWAWLGENNSFAPSAPSGCPIKEIPGFSPKTEASFPKVWLEGVGAQSTKSVLLTAGQSHLPSKGNLQFPSRVVRGWPGFEPSSVLGP